MCCFLHLCTAPPAPVVTLFFSGDSIPGLTYALQCSVIVAPHIVELTDLKIDLKILFPNTTVITAMNSSSLNYTFSPLRTSDAGPYTCSVSLSIPQAGILDLMNSTTKTLVIVVGRYNIACSVK